MTESPLMCAVCHHSFTWHYDGQTFPCHQPGCKCAEFHSESELVEAWNTMVKRMIMDEWGHCWHEAAA